MGRAGSNTIVETEALILGRVVYGEADLIVQVLTTRFGRIAALARGARRNHKRFGGALEPMHTLKLELGEKPRGELYSLQGASIEHARTRLTSHLEAMTTAGQALKWVKKSVPQNLSDSLIWQALTAFLDRLDQKEAQPFASSHLASFGLNLLRVLGWGVNLSTCISCARSCPPNKNAWIHPERGGLVCRSCGGGPFQVSGALRAELNDAQQGSSLPLSSEAIAIATQIIDRTLHTHVI